ncbi:shikimate dehydrogenase [Methylobrevis pamukkalensis]|uniref:Shikimate dehydrogenase (NADP(+)) n=1 Tax=Methylobrevis pamukkalensis TaxID=1439726 RepID=A0A1E3H9G6_9HYPH|nr:shikimate dehydrogenase [Methylobrevis pamukkalensis]ODN72131.1 Shikimate dehydrogenase [Methylobrevis pamukkalensis]
MTGPLRAGVVGWPVAHSRSPLIHGHWLARHGIDGRYDRIPVAPDAIGTFLAGLKASGLRGANVTIPHKEAAFLAAEVADPVASFLRAANTLWLEDGRLHAANTDVHGFLANLDDRAPGWDAAGGAALVLGAGGAARAIVYGLARRGFAPIRLVNRTRDRAEAIAGLFPGKVTVHGWDEVSQLVGEARLVVNTTSLGMKGEPPLDIDFSGARADLLVTDAVYVPLDTPLILAARAQGLATVDGLGMLLHQAVPGFERWFGVRPEVTPELREMILADLGAAP